MKSSNKYTYKALTWNTHLLLGNRLYCKCFEKIHKPQSFSVRTICVNTFSTDGELNAFIFLITFTNVSFGWQLSNVRLYQSCYLSFLTIAYVNWVLRYDTIVLCLVCIINKSCLYSCLEFTNRLNPNQVIKNGLKKATKGARFIEGTERPW